MNKIIVNGTFDIVHRGHIEMLNYAKSLGGYLLVLIDTDSRVKELKGNQRPINNQYDRQFVLKNIKAVDDVWFFNSCEDLICKIKLYNPDVMVKGSDYRGCSIIGEEHIPRIEFFERIDEYSTSKTIQYICDR